MLEKNMTLAQMLEFNPSDTDMLSLPLEAIVYLKITILSDDQDTNMGLIKHLFTNEEANNYFYDLTNSNIFDFSVPNNGGFINIVEALGTAVYGEMSIFIKELLESYMGESECVIDLYTHDNNHYRYSLLDHVFGSEKVIDGKKS